MEWIGKDHPHHPTHSAAGGTRPSLAQLLRQLSPCDLVLIEGYKSERHPKLEVFRDAVGKAPLYPEDRHIVAVASSPMVTGIRLPVVDLNDIEAVGNTACACAEPFDAVLARLEERPAEVHHL